MTNQETAVPVQKRLAVRGRLNRLNYKDWILRIVIFILIFGSLGLSWWSLTQRLGPLQKRSRELSSAVAKLSVQVDELDRKWSVAESEQIHRRIERAHDKLFTDEAALNFWLVNLKTEGAPLGLQPKAEFDKPIHQPVEKSEELAVIPAAIHLDFLTAPEIQQNESSYQRLLRLTQRLCLHSKRADLTEMRVEAGARSISSAALSFGLWAAEGGTP